MEQRRPPAIPQRKGAKDKARKEAAPAPAASAAALEDGDEEDEEVAAGDDKKRRPNSTSPSSSAAAKRGAAGGGGGAALPCCQAEMCTADLTAAKRYHRRHKVCEAHSKAAVVVVAGLRQRFCQQCSRFHELSEFDDSKRSCRRRLAGHNERRRKSSSDSQGDGLSRCRAADPEGRIQMSDSGSSTYKHFQIRDVMWVPLYVDCSYFLLALFFLVLASIFRSPTIGVFKKQKM